jgi:hypothetical protein
MTSVKSAPEKSLAQKTDFLRKNGFFINRSEIFTALPKFYATRQNYEILSKSLVPSIQ